MLSTTRNLWARRSLLQQLTFAELKSSTSESHAGWLWWLLDPFLTMMVYWAVVVGIFGRGADYHPYPLFILCALLPFRHLSSAATACCRALRNREGLIRAIPFPTIVIPLSIALSRFGFFAFGTIVLLGAAVAWERPLGAALIQLPLLFGCQILLISGIALVLASLGALVADLSDLLGHILRLLFYACPTIYGMDMAREALGAAPAWVWHLYRSNPFAILFEGYRDAVFRNTFSDPGQLALLTLSSVVVLMLGFAFFQYFDRKVIKFL